MRTLEDMEANARRQLDGMTANRDVMAKDVLQLAATVRATQQAAEKAAAMQVPWSERKREPDVPEFFKGIFG